ncbi:putative lipid II flippase FtsW [Hornefia butyriciproducens]|uniref:putative lipid II flippase FtsW n=1 Tax=Hornefia butyriciproducens TaxID=2652293 RepID=UPI003F8AA7D3
MKKRSRTKLSEELSILKRLRQCDFTVLLLVVILVIFGVVMVFSASYYNSINYSGTPYTYLKKQLFFALTGAALMYATSVVDYHLYRRFDWILLILSLVLLVLLFTPLGVTTNGATRWLRVGPLSIMPGEIAKVAAILFTASFFADEPNRVLSLKRGVLPMAGLMALLGILIIKQPNLSTALTVVGIIAGMMFLSGLQWRYLIGAFGLGAGGLLILSQTGTYWGDRLTSFTDPFKDAQGDGFQAVQSLLALGTGGLFGLGLGKSVQKNLYLPEPQNDFILAIIGEELGLVGVLILMLVFVLLVWRCSMVTINAPDQFGMLLAGGVALMIGIQVVLNVAVVTSSMPPTGIALPFVSYGGNALWIFMGMAGVVLNISRQSRTLNPEQKKKKQNRVQRVRERERERRERESLI